MKIKPPKQIGDMLYAIGSSIYRVSGPEGGLCAYLVETSAGLVQVNTVPELFKTYFPHLRKLPVAVCMTAPVVSQLGDTLTGFEFELWQSRFLDFSNPHRVKFIGHESHIQMLYKRLELTMNGDFIPDEQGVAQAQFVSRRWVDDVFEWMPGTGEVALGNHVSIDVSDPTSVRIFDKGKLLFDSAMYPVTLDRDGATLYVDSLISQIDPLVFNPDELGIIVAGAGIGSKPGVTSNFLLHYADRLIWIDPPARFYEKAAHLKVNPDQVTDFIISHCHEDHIEGFSALLQRKIEHKQPLRLLSTPAIYDQLKSIFDPLFGNIAPHIEFSDLHDRSQFESYHGCNIDIRDNYHPVPTIGFKLTYNGKVVGISGDTIYSKRVLDARLKNGSIDQAAYERLSPQWYADTKFFFHDTTLNNDPVHTSLQNVEQFAGEISQAKPYSYHFHLEPHLAFPSSRITPAVFGDRIA
ncbi:MAG: hypothetical protein IAF08_07690 [Rhizobacter sp.]|nr:hypothetical protein [Chlorobiales bacterium]